MKKFRFLADIALADVAFEACGKTLEELFENAGLALMEVMVESATVSPLLSEKLKMKNEKLDDLLYDFLEELIFLKDSKQLLFSKFEIKITQLDAKGHTLNAILWGEKINPQKHRLRTDIKAVTYHLFSLKKEKNLYKARVVLDV